MDVNTTRAFARSEDAERLRRSVSGVASKWLTTENRRSGLADLVRAIIEVAEDAIIPELRLWNARNDRLSLLPVELRLHCFSFLPSAMLLTASSVCVGWNELICGTPDLWTHLDLTRAPLLSRGELARALRLSQDRPLSVTAVVLSRNQVHALDYCLALAWHRLRSLSIDHGGYRLPADYDILRMPAPELASLTYLGPDPLLSVGSLLGGHAPKLRTLVVRERLFQHRLAGDWQPALQGLTTLTMRTKGPVPPDFFLMLPELRTLDVFDTPNHAQEPFCLPQLPRRHPLARLRLRRYAPGTALALRDLGFMRVPHLSVEGNCVDVIANALGASAPLSLSAEVSESRLSLSLTPDKPNPTSGVFFSCNGFPSGEVAKLFREPPATDVFASLTALSLPRDVPLRCFFARDDHVDASLHRNLFPTAPLPQLRTLTIVCGPRAGDVLLDPHILEKCGTLLAPVLVRLEFVRARGAVEPERVCPLEVALFVSHHLSVERPELLHVVVDRDVGFVEHGDGGAAIEVLESHVGSVSVQAV